MIKIFYYELRRLLLNKLFVGIFLISLWYGWMTLTGTTVQGISHTAPFSPWSFGDYLARMLPVICLGELFFLTFFTSMQERRVAVIIQATSVDLRKYAAVRCGAVLLGTLVICLGVIGLGLGFYSYFFGWTDFKSLFLPALLVLGPSIVFCLGLGWTLGKLHPLLVYVGMAVPFLLSWFSSQLNFPWTAEFSMGRFFTEYPLTLDVLDPVFTVPAPVLFGRLVYLLMGIFLFWWSQMGVKRLPIGNG